MEKCFCIEDLFKQIDTYEKQYLVNETAPDEQDECACSHFCRINNLFWAFNEFTKKHIIIGCYCVKKPEIVNFHINVKNALLEKKYKKDHPDQQCNTCDKIHRNTKIKFRCNEC